MSRGKKITISIQAQESIDMVEVRMYEAGSLGSAEANAVTIFVTDLCLSLMTFESSASRAGVAANQIARDVLDVPFTTTRVVVTAIIY